MSSKYVLDKTKYGKTKVRVFKVTRPRHSGKDMHVVHDLTVEVLLEGDFDRSYFSGDNSTTVPTDTVKNTVFVLAKQNPLNSIEEFGEFVSNHFLQKYAQVSAVHCDIIQHSWDRLGLANPSGKQVLHDFAFSKRSPEIAGCTVSHKRGGKPVVVSRLQNLIVLKTTENGFSGFPKCEYTTLKECDDRILCTAVECEWTFNRQGKGMDYVTTREKLRENILSVFASKFSNSVQKVIWDMGGAILDTCKEIETVHFSLPNIHHFEYDIDRFGLKNDDQIYMPTNEPSGLIQGTVCRSRPKL